MKRDICEMKCGTCDKGYGHYLKNVFPYADIPFLKEMEYLKMRNLQLATCDVRLEDCDARLALRDMHFAACTGRPASCDMRFEHYP